MIRWIVEWSLKFRVLVVALTLGVIMIGAAQVRTMPVDALPEFAPPYVEVQTEAPGLSAAEVEELISFNLEELLNGTPFLQSIHSTSVPGLSSITLTFQPGTDVIRARQLVSERLSLAFALPNVAQPPVILQPLSATSRVMMVGLSSHQMSAIEMSVLARWNIRPALLSVPGVANVSIWGMRDRQLQVLVDPQHLQQKNVTLDQVVSTTGNALWVSPLSFLNASTPGSGGWIDGPQQRLEVRHVLPISSPHDLAQVNVEGTNMRLGDVATVVEDHQPLIGDNVLNNGNGLLLVIEKFPNANTQDVTQGIEAKLRELQPGLSGIQINTGIFRPASFVEMAISNLANMQLIGLLLIFLVFFAFLYNWRTALISLIMIPLSLLAAGIVLSLRGATLNLLILAGLMIAVGTLIDDAVISVESVAQRVRERRRTGSEELVAGTILSALLETRSAMIYATLILLLAVVPLLLLEGVFGAFFQPLALSYALAILASLLVALTITPALCLLLLPGVALERRESPLLLKLQQGYSALLRRVFATMRPVLFVGIAFVMGLIALIGLAVLPSRGTPLLPAFREPDVIVQWQATPGTSYPEMARITSLVSRELRTIPGVRSTAANIGRAVLGDQIVDVNSAELEVGLDPTANYDATTAAIQKVVSGYPGIFHNVQTYLQEKTRQAQTGANSDIVVRIFGPDLAQLHTQANEVKHTLAQIGGAVDVQMDQQVEVPQLQIKVDLAKAQRYGLKPGDVRRLASTLVAGITAGSLFEGQKVFDVVVWGTPASRQSFSSVRALLIDTPDGGRVRLSDVADVSIAPTQNLIQHETVSRRIDVSLNVRGRDPAAVLNDVNQRLQQIKFPLEYHARVLGIYADQQAAQIRLLGFGIAAALGVFLLLQAFFGSWRLATLLFLTLPTALAGGVVVALTTNPAISFASLAGLLAIFAIAVRNSMLLIQCYQRLERDEGMASGPELVLRGTQERLVPILMTTFALGLALVPLALARPLPGLEIAHPMALVILGGLFTSMLLTLLILPTLYLGFFGQRKSVEESYEEMQIQEKQVHPGQSPVPQRLTMTYSRGWRPTKLWLPIIPLLVCLLLSACGPAAESASSDEDASPATVVHIAGTKLSRLTLTDAAIKRLGIQTASVQRSGKQQTVIPYAAVLYDVNGQTWVYTNPAPRTYIRASITVDRISGDTVLLVKGPAIGTQVVTVGGPELYGTEFGVDGTGA